MLKDAFSAETGAEGAETGGAEYYGNGGGLDMLAMLYSAAVTYEQGVAAVTRLGAVSARGAPRVSVSEKRFFRRGTPDGGSRLCTHQAVTKHSGTRVVAPPARIKQGRKNGTRGVTRPGRGWANRGERFFIAGDDAARLG